MGAPASQPPTGALTPPRQFCQHPCSQGPGLVDELAGLVDEIAVRAHLPLFIAPGVMILPDDLPGHPATIADYGQEPISVTCPYLGMIRDAP